MVLKLFVYINLEKGIGFWLRKNARQILSVIPQTVPLKKSCGF